MISYRISKARQSINMSLTTLSDLMELPKEYLKKYEDGTAIPSGPSIAKLSEHLQVSVEHLLRPLPVKARKNFLLVRNFRDGDIEQRALPR